MMKLLLAVFLSLTTLASAHCESLDGLDAGPGR